jgi:hypothetical protein
MLALVGVAFFCAYMGGVVISHGGHNTSSGGSSPLAHVIHAKNITSAPVTGSLLSIITFLLIAFTLLISSYVPGLFLQRKPILFLWRTCAEALYHANKKVNYWLSLFERNPQLILSA